jgi:DNA-binding transcriptional LysR family regulator
MSLDAIRVFQVVARAQSFTKAAAQLGQDKSQVSRTVRALERELNVALLVRTTRSVRVTVEGLALLERVEPLVAGLEQAIAATPDRAEVPSGEVVVTSTPDLGRAVLAPMLVGFRRRFPLVRVRVVLSSTVVNLMTEGVELALRAGRPGGEGLVARKVGELSAGFFAAPGYLERRGTPTRLEQLARHEGLWPTPLKGQTSFAPGPIASRAAVACADFGLLAEVARAGGGVAVLPTFLAAREVATGALVRVLPDVSLAGAPLYLVSRPVRPLPPRVAALRGFLLEAFRAL